MKFGLIHYNAPGETVEAFLDFAAEAGFDGVELQSNDLWDEADSAADPLARAAEVRAYAAQRGLYVGAVAARNDFLTTDAAECERQVARMRTVCAMTAAVGATVIRADGGWRGEQVPEEYWIDAMAANFRAVMPFCDEYDVKIGLDNHGRTTNDARLQLMVLGLVSNVRFGTVMDTMNYRWAGHSIETCNRFYELSAQRCFHLHLKDGTGSFGEYKGAVLGQGEIDLAHAVRALKQYGYQGMWCIEYEGPDPYEYADCLAWAKEHVPAIA